MRVDLFIFQTTNHLKIEKEMFISTVTAKNEKKPVLTGD